MLNKVLIIYTGGTIGMVQDENGSLQPFAMDRIFDAVPQLKYCTYDIESCPRGDTLTGTGGQL